ncbi:MAG TPA: Uma2 family endonuclease [Gemmata sp.]|nr:Uma2 family endonuclease [Gemmata sp.]
MTNATLTIPTTPPAPTPVGLTLDEFLERYAGAYVEVIEGEVKEIPMPQPLHGRVCTKAGRFLDEFAEANQLGVVCSNDTFVLIRREPLQVRGADVVFWGKAKAPDGVPAKGMITAAPDLCVEVVSPTNTWSEVFTKVGEYLGIGVPAVVVLDPDTRTASVYRNLPGQGQQIFNSGDTLAIPDVLPGFAVPVARFFE